MMNVLYQAHSGWRYLVILIFVLAIAKFLISWLTNGKWSSLDQWLGLLTPISLDVQATLGIILWIVRQQWTIPVTQRTWEHPVTMIVVLILAHVTWTRVKRAPTDRAKFQTGAVGYIIAGLVLALGIYRITSLA